LAIEGRAIRIMARRLRKRSHEIDEISTTTGKERQAGFAEVDRNRGPIGRG
jgi:hypothetical protein